MQNNADNKWRERDFYFFSNSIWYEPWTAGKGKMFLWGPFQIPQWVVCENLLSNKFIFLSCTPHSLRQPSNWEITCLSPRQWPDWIDSVLVCPFSNSLPLCYYYYVVTAFFFLALAYLVHPPLYCQRNSINCLFVCVYVCGSSMMGLFSCDNTSFYTFFSIYLFLWNLCLSHLFFPYLAQSMVHPRPPPYGKPSPHTLTNAACYFNLSLTFCELHRS